MRTNHFVRILMGVAVLMLLISCGDGKDKTGEGGGETDKPETIDSLPATDVPTDTLLEEAQGPDMPEENLEQDERKAVLIQITEPVKEPGDRFRVCRALDLAVKLVEENDVMVYFDVQAVLIVLKETEDFRYAPFAPAKEQVQNLINKGATVGVCGPCLEAEWKKPEELMSGVKIVGPGDLLSFSDKATVSFTY